MPPHSAPCLLQVLAVCERLVGGGKVDVPGCGCGGEAAVGWVSCIPCRTGACLLSIALWLIARGTDTVLPCWAAYTHPCM
jgi:hypothetical protein